MSTLDQLLGIGAGIALLSWGVIGTARERKIRRHGVSVQGTVTRKNTGAKYCELFLTFQTKGGEKIEAEYSPMFSYNNRQYKVGDIVAIAYLPEDPLKIQILCDRMTYVLSAMFFFMGMFWLTMMYWMEKTS